MMDSSHFNVGKPFYTSLEMYLSNLRTQISQQMSEYDKKKVS